MTDTLPPSLDEVVLGAFLEDIGKFMQRAHRGTAELPQEVLNRASVLLPAYQGRSSHWHALWTDAFFHELERRGVTLPGGLNLDRVRDGAVFHHRPATPLHWLSAEADRLSAGMDRKPRDEAEESQDAPASGGRGAFRRTALRSIFANVDLGLRPGRRPDPAETGHTVAELSPDALRPGPVDGAAQAGAYAGLWPRFMDGFAALCRDAPNLHLFHEGLLSLSERFTWAIPSSTIDQPDVPLHDHDKSVAAIAACLYRYHAEHGEIDNEAAIRDRGIAKFRFLVGDLSGIQSSLFRLASQQVKGAARILRARSFLMGATVEAVSLACRRALDLPPYCELQAAGGRFLLLVPVTAGLEQRVAALRAEVEQWLAARYLGDLTLNLALGAPLTGDDLMQKRFRAALEDAGRAVLRAKMMPLASVPTGVLDADYAAGADGACAACGVRPATRADGETRRCQACHDAHEIGSRLPRARAIVMSEGRLPDGLGTGPSVEMPCGLRLAVLTGTLRADDRDAWRRIPSGYRLLAEAAEGAGAEDPALPPALRHIANHVPRLAAGAEGSIRYRDLDGEALALAEGDQKTFAHIAADSREEVQGNLRGRPMLAVLKADVDRLGQIFAGGLGEDLSLGRLATLSRMMDAFFTIVLPDLLRRKHPDTYTVYAGGDDLLLLGPWLGTIRLAEDIAAAFAAHVGQNPQVTLSAGIEFCGPHEPIGRAVKRAEQRLAAAKDGGRNAVGAIEAQPLRWPALSRAVQDAERVNGWIRDGDRPLSTAFVYRTLATARQRDKAAAGKDIRAANWRARWAYAVGRSFDRDRSGDAERLRFSDGLLGSGLTAEATGEGAAIASLTVALYRNR